MEGNNEMVPWSEAGVAKRDVDEMHADDDHSYRAKTLETLRKLIILTNAESDELKKKLQ